MPEENEKKRIPFTSGGCFADDIIDWVEKVRVINEVSKALLWYESEKVTFTATSVIEDHGEKLCEILDDYVEAIELKLFEHCEVLSGIENKIVLPLKELYHDYDCMKETNQLSAIRLIDKDLSILKDFEDVISPALALKSRFNDIKKRILAEQEQAAANIKAA